MGAVTTAQSDDLTPTRGLFLINTSLLRQAYKASLATMAASNQAAIKDGQPCPKIQSNVGRLSGTAKGSPEPWFFVLVPGR
jgi:hypothetical protein